MELLLEPISAGALAGYGEVLERPAISLRQDRAATVENSRASARPNVALIRAELFSGQPVTVMERHRSSNQLFVPLDVNEYVVLVARGDREPDLQTLRGFRANGRQAINYLPDVWHIGMATLERPGIFIMLIHEDGGPGDCEFRAIAPVLLRWKMRGGE